MSTSKLKSIFNDGIFPFEDIKPSDPEYFKIYEKIGEEIEYFIKRMPHDDVQRFERFENLFSKVESLFHYDCFEYGFKLGAQLMMEVFMNEG